MQEIDNEDIITIRTLECDLCMKFDSIMLPKSVVDNRTSSNSLKIGTHILSHGDHTRIVYFDKSGRYLGDTISLKLNKEQTSTEPSILPIFPKHFNLGTRRIQKKLFKYFMNNSHKLCIVGPSYAGKTSLSIYIESGVPERYNYQCERSPTMSKSIKRLNLGKTNLTMFDMGGQSDFWREWISHFHKADKIIYVVDGTADNILEIKNTIKLTLLNRKGKPVLILINKMDLLLEGYSDKFFNISEINTIVGEYELSDVWILDVSIYNGIVYNYKERNEETSLLSVLDEFITN
jgi:signal recognition particle receptor subunit beta